VSQRQGTRSRGEIGGVGPSLFAAAGHLRLHLQSVQKRLVPGNEDNAVGVEHRAAPLSWENPHLIGPDGFTKHSALVGDGFCFIPLARAVDVCRHVHPVAGHEPLELISSCNQ
jgi:hypothetical protein